MKLVFTLANKKKATYRIPKKVVRAYRCVAFVEIKGAQAKTRYVAIPDDVKAVDLVNSW